MVEERMAIHELRASAELCLRFFLTGRFGLLEKVSSLVIVVDSSDADGKVEGVHDERVLHGPIDAVYPERHDEEENDARCRVFLQRKYACNRKQS